MVATSSVGIGIVILYSIFVALPFFRGPFITVNEPSYTDNGTLYLSGMTERVSKLSVNELEIPISDTGTFAVERAYARGYTVVVIQASDRFGRSRTETHTFVTKPHASKKERASEINKEE